MVIALGRRQDFLNIINTCHEAATERDGSRDKAGAGLLRRAELQKTHSKGLVNQFFQAGLLCLQKPSQKGSHITVQSKGCPHASKHNSFDVLMSNVRPRLLYQLASVRTWQVALSLA